MSIAEMQQYLAYCLEGPSSIPVRKEMLAKKQDELREKIKLLQEAVDYIDWIADLLNPEHPEDAYATEMLLMAYNQGWAGAKESWSLGTYSTYYSRVVMGSYAAFMEEMEVEP